MERRKAPRDRPAEQLPSPPVQKRFWLDHLESLVLWLLLAAGLTLAWWMFSHWWTPPR